MTRPILLVGDNPFLGISHLSQERARGRSRSPSTSGAAAEIVIAGVENGADGFMFSLGDTTLSILEEVGKRMSLDGLKLVPLIPYAYDWVRLATFNGGVFGIGKQFAGRMLRSVDAQALWHGARGILRADIAEMLSSYVALELRRLKRVQGGAQVTAVMLHEVLTDLALALNLEDIFRKYVGLLRSRGIRPGLETRNFALLVQRLREWGIDTGTLWIAAPFNRAGFQMTASRIDCERALASLPGGVVIAMSIFAAGYLSRRDAIEYVQQLPHLGGVVVGVSSVSQAQETFSMLRQVLGK